MFAYQFHVQSQKPEALTTYDTLIYPFDNYIWYFIGSFSTAIFLALITIQIIWIHVSGEKPPFGWIFQGLNQCLVFDQDELRLHMFSDLVLALTPLVDETIPYKFYYRGSFIKSRQLLLIQWLMWANILSHAYKSTLLSTLCTIRYTEPLDTADQMDASGLPFYVLGGTAMEWLAKSDPREVVKQLNDKRYDMPFDGTIEEKYLKM